MNKNIHPFNNDRNDIILSDNIDSLIPSFTIRPPQECKTSWFTIIIIILCVLFILGLLLVLFFQAHHYRRELKNSVFALTTAQDTLQTCMNSCQQCKDRLEIPFTQELPIENLKSVIDTLDTTAKIAEEGVSVTELAKKDALQQCDCEALHDQLSELNRTNRQIETICMNQLNGIHKEI